MVCYSCRRTMRVCCSLYEWEENFQPPSTHIISGVVTCISALVSRRRYRSKAFSAEMFSEGWCRLEMCVFFLKCTYGSWGIQQRTNIRKTKLHYIETSNSRARIVLQSRPICFRDPHTLASHVTRISRQRRRTTSFVLPRSPLGVDHIFA